MSPAFIAALAGFSLGLSFILAIGAQNAFVLRQGLRQNHVLAVVLTCAVSDAILITIGVAGFSWLITTAPWIEPAMTLLGSAFLIAYGILSARRAFVSSEALEAADTKPLSLRRTVAITLAFTWLNPHVYLDTVILLGTTAAQYTERLAFGIGAVIASFVFFFALGFGAKQLAPVFAKPMAWRVLDALVALVMWGIAAKLLIGAP
ncbi:MAG: LysE/ArgO family amino acid transporter [Pseudomonadota bacterium]